MIEYRTLNVRIESLYEDRYKAIVCGPDGDGQAVFELPFDARSLDALASAVSRPRSARRRIESDESAQAREFGERLFGLVFRDTAHEVLRASFSHARRENHGLRLMFQLEGARHLRNVPWELLCDSTKFMSTSAYTPVLRYVDIPSRPPPLSVRAPLRILGMVSSPADMPALDAEREREHLAQACSSLTDKGLVKIDWVEQATLAGLLKCLNLGDYHIFHFIGHGDFDEQAEDGVLLFEGRAGRSHRVTGVELGTILGDQHTLRLAVINACEGARVALDSSGIATSLMRYGTPAVIAMQFEISDEAAIGFAEHFYESVARSHPIDESLADARRGMFAAGHGLEWATPVLFTCVDDGRLFDVGWEEHSQGASASSHPAVQAGLTPQAAAPALKPRAGLDAPNGPLDQPARAVRAEAPQETDRSGAVAGAQSHVQTWAQADHDGDRPRPQLPLRAIGIAVALLAVAAAALAVAGVFSGHSGPKIGVPIRVGARPVGIAVGQGRVWVTSSDAGTLSSIDPRKNRQARVTVEDDPNSVAVEPNGYIWVALFNAKQVIWVNPRQPPRNPEFVDARTVGLHPNTIAVGYGGAWVANSGDGTVSRIDLETKNVDPIEGVGRHPSGIVTGLGAVWVANSGGRTIARIDPDQKKVDKTIPVGSSTQGVAVGDGSVWVTDPVEGMVSRIDPDSGKVVKTIPVGHNPQGIVAALGDIWVTNSDDGTVSRIDPGSDKLLNREIKVGGKPNAIAAGPQGPVWVANLENDTVTSITP